MLSHHANVQAEEEHLSCKNQNFTNVYYLIDSNNVDNAIHFFQHHSTDIFGKNTKFTSVSGRRERVITYYDTNNQALLNNNYQLSFILDENLPQYRKDKEKIRFIRTSAGIEETHNYEVKYYNKKLAPLDKHPLFRYIKRKDRPLLLSQLSEININNPLEVSESLKVKSKENVHLLMLYGVNYAAVTLSRFSFFDFAVPNNFYLLKLEVFKNKQDEFVEEERRALDAFFCLIDKQFQKNISPDQVYSSFGYSEYNKLALDVLPSHTFFRKYPFLFSIGQIICLTFIGFLFIYLILGRYKKQSNFRKIMKT